MQRDRSADGAIIASSVDYQAARDLLASIIDVAAREGLSDIVRETVEAVPSRGYISLTELANELGLAKSTASRRVEQAIDGGWIANEEWRRGRPARLGRADPLPDSFESLPTVEQVLDAFECSQRSTPDEAGA